MNDLTPKASLPVDGYQLRVECGRYGSVIRLVDDRGGEPLRVELGPTGPVLYVGTGLGIAIAGPLAFSAERVTIHGHEGVQLSSAGNIHVQCEGDILSEAREHRVHARLGDIQLSANDDVKLLGERIRLNS